MRFWKILLVPIVTIVPPFLPAINFAATTRYVATTDTDSGNCGNRAAAGPGPGCDYVLFEENIAYGGARYMFLNYWSDHSVFRRNVARNDYWNDVLQSAAFTNYDSYGTVWQNNIAIDGDTKYCTVHSGLYAGFFNEFKGDRTDAMGALHPDNTSGSLRYLPRGPEPGSVLATAGESSGRVGARVLWKIGVDGTLYGEPGWNVERSPENGYGGANDGLWPWPNEAIIKAEFASYNGPGLVGPRGFAAAGNGLYGGSITLTSYIWEYLGSPCPATICSGASIIFNLLGQHFRNGPGHRLKGGD